MPDTLATAEASAACSCIVLAKGLLKKREEAGLKTLTEVSQQGAIKSL